FGMRTNAGGERKGLAKQARNLCVGLRLGNETAYDSSLLHGGIGCANNIRLACSAVLSYKFHELLQCSLLTERVFTASAFQEGNLCPLWAS
ncbi:MAG: hypothetical protein II132_10520, partial [Desulfovibrio sp.]|nr:hypothetical protein [Desulfovibrio sp.]